MTHFKDLDYYNDLIMDNCTLPAYKINEAEIREAIRKLEIKLVRHVFNNCIDEYAIIMQEQRSQLKILLLEALKCDTKEEIEKLEYITRINILYLESRGSSQS